MKTALLLLSTGLLLNSAYATESLLNGGFAGSAPFSGWDPFGSPTPPTAPNASPFTGDYPASTQSVQFVQTTAGFTLGPGVSQNFSDLNSDFRLSFDFNVQSNGADYWFVLPGFAQTFETQFIANLRIDDQGDFAVEGGDKEWRSALSLKTWYHVDADFSFENQTIDGTLQAFGGAVQTWSGIGFLQNVPAINYLSIQDNMPFTTNGEMLLDNVSVRNDFGLPASAVPEPTTYGFIGAALLSIPVLLRRRARA